MSKNQLSILLTSDNIDTIELMVSMYAMNSVNNNWWNSVRVIIWGAPSKLILNSDKFKEIIRDMLENNVEVFACRACALKCQSVEEFEKLGVVVDYMGVELTHCLKYDEALITI